MKITYLSLACVLGLAMAVTQHYAMLYSWYWTYWWLDVVMHFSGGVVITLIGAAYLGVSVRVVYLTVTIGVLWEVYEFVIGLSVAEPNFVSDTLSDLAMDTLGTLSAYGMMRLWDYTLPSRVEHDASPDQTSSSK